MRRLSAGEAGSLRVLVTLAVIWAIFAIAHDRFLTPINLTNLALQTVAVGTVSVGVVLVLLLGEIDLSVGAVSGLAGAVAATLSVKHGWNPVLAMPPRWASGRRSGRSRARSPRASRSRPSSSRSRACSRGRALSCACSARAERST